MTSENGDKPEKERGDEELVTYADIKCEHCDYKETKPFETPITYLEFHTKWVWTVKCPKCGSKCISLPVLEGEDEKDDDEKKTRAQLVLETATDNIEKLFVDEYQEPHAAISVNEDHLETVLINSKRFRNYLSSLVYKDSGDIVDSQTLKDVTGILSAKAMFDESSEIVKLNLRVAELDGKWYYDLTNKNWEFIEITSNGWKIVNNLVLFHRYNNQLPQVYPSREYEKDIFDKFISLVLNSANVEDEKKLAEYRILTKCYIVCAFIAGFPKAVPMPNGTQGAAKTTFMECQKMLIDPCAAKTFSFPRDITELVQQLSHNYVTYYDNISDMHDWVSDQLCRAVSGSGSSKRVLYSDDDDFIRSFKRCIGLNGINLAATKPDMLDRAIFFKLKRIPDKDRRDILEIEREFEAMRPQILGYIMDVLVKVKKWKENNELKISSLPRMADWARHCEIISRCMGYKPEEFLNAYRENAKIQTEQVMETSLIATCIAHFVDTDPRFNGRAMLKDQEGNTIWAWIGVASSLKGELEAIADKLKIDIKSKGWPRNPSWLIRKINEILHTLKDAGIEIAYDQTTRGKKNIMIRKLPLLAMMALQTENHAQKEGENCNGICNGKTKDNEMALQNHAQKPANNGNNGNNGNLHTLRGERAATPYGCPSCNFSDPDPAKRDAHIQSEHNGYRS
jgi:hypothetical protein